MTLSALMTDPRFRLREVLEDAGISQTDFAREADLSFATINRLCTNATAQVSLETLDRIMSALEKRGVEIDGEPIALDDLIDRKAAKRRGKG
jgi:transcriptional regulator with XRE-family HTH domain